MAASAVIVSQADCFVRAGAVVQAVGYDLAPDHRLMLVVASKDQLYSDASVDGSATTISSPDGSAAHLTLPLG